MKNEHWANPRRGKIHLFFCQSIVGESGEYYIIGFPTWENQKALMVADIACNCLTEFFSCSFFEALKTLKKHHDFITDPKTDQSLLGHSYVYTYVFCRSSWRPFILWGLQLMRLLRSNRFVVHFGNDVIGRAMFSYEGARITASIPKLPILAW